MQIPGAVPQDSAHDDSAARSSRATGEPCALHGNICASVCIRCQLGSHQLLQAGSPLLTHNALCSYFLGPPCRACLSLFSPSITVTGPARVKAGPETPQGQALCKRFRLVCRPFNSIYFSPIQFNATQCNSMHVRIKKPWEPITSSHLRKPGLAAEGGRAPLTDRGNGGESQEALVSAPSTRYRGPLNGCSCPRLFEAPPNPPCPTPYSDHFLKMNWKLLSMCCNQHVTGAPE